MYMHVCNPDISVLRPHYANLQQMHMHICSTNTMYMYMYKKLLLVLASPLGSNARLDWQSESAIWVFEKSRRSFFCLIFQFVQLHYNTKQP